MIVQLKTCNAFRLSMLQMMYSYHFLIKNEFKKDRCGQSRCICVFGGANVTCHLTKNDMLTILNGLIIKGEKVNEGRVLTFTKVFLTENRSIWFDHDILFSYYLFYHMLKCNHMTTLLHSCRLALSCQEGIAPDCFQSYTNVHLLLRLLCNCQI